MSRENPLRFLPGVWKSYVLLFNTTNQIVNERLSEEMKREGFDVSPREAWVLMAAKEKPLGQGVIADCLNINTNVMVRMVDRLEKKGLARRTKDSRNRRGHKLEVTRKGHELLKRLYEGWDSRTQRIFYPATWDDIKRYEQVARSIIDDHYSKKKRGPTRRPVL